MSDQQASPWDALPVLTDIVEEGSVTAISSAPEVPVLVDFDIPDFDFSAEMASLAQVLPESDLSFPDELTLDEVLPDEAQINPVGPDGRLDPQALIDILPSLDLDVPLPEDLDLVEVLPGFAMPDDLLSAHEAEGLAAGSAMEMAEAIAASAGVAAAPPEVPTVTLDDGAFEDWAALSAAVPTLADAPAPVLAANLVPELTLDEVVATEAIAPVVLDAGADDEPVVMNAHPVDDLALMSLPDEPAVLVPVVDELPDAFVPEIEPLVAAESGALSVDDIIAGMMASSSELPPAQAEPVFVPELAVADEVLPWDASPSAPAPVSPAVEEVLEAAMVVPDLLPSPEPVVLAADFSPSAPAPVFDPVVADDVVEAVVDLTSSPESVALSADISLPEPESVLPAVGDGMTKAAPELAMTLATAQTLAATALETSVVDDEVFVPSDAVDVAADFVRADGADGVADDAGSGAGDALASAAAPLPADDFSFDLDAAQGLVPVGVAAAFAATLAAEAEVAPAPVFQSISLDSLPTGVLGGGLGLAADVERELSGIDDEVERAWARDMGVTLPDEPFEREAAPLMMAQTVAPDLPELPPEAVPVAAVVSDIHLAAVKSMQPSLAANVTAGQALQDAGLVPDVLIESLYARVLPRMKVELTLWMQDALEMQAKQLMSGVMQHLKEDFDMMLAEALRESLREAIDEAQQSKQEQV